MSLGYSREGSLGGSTSQSKSRPSSRAPVRSAASTGGRLSPSMSPSRPQLRRESAQDLGDGEEATKLLHLQLSTQNPPDLKIDLLSDASSTASNTPYSLSSRSPSQSSSKRGCLNLLGAPGNVSNLRRHSHNLRLTPRNKSAPVTPLNRSTTNVAAVNSNGAEYVELNQ